VKTTILGSQVVPDDLRQLVRPLQPIRLTKKSRNFRVHSG